jgi:spoIIIJ-associated protein
MPNDERKVIHKALNDWHNIRTESEGEGAARHLCIKYVPDAPKEEAVEEPAEEAAAEE